MDKEFRNIFSGDKEIFDRIGKYVKDDYSQITGTSLCYNNFIYYLSNKSQVKFDGSTLSVSVSGIDNKLLETFRDIIIEECDKKELPFVNVYKVNVYKK